MPHPCANCHGKVSTPRNPRVKRPWCHRCWMSAPLILRRANTRMWKNARKAGWPSVALPASESYRWTRLTRRIAQAIIERRP